MSRSDSLGVRLSKPCEVLMIVIMITMQVAIIYQAPSNVDVQWGCKEVPSSLTHVMSLQAAMLTKLKIIA